MNKQSSAQREITLRFLAPTSDVNFLGNIHGGAVMKWIDEAAYTCAAGWCRRDCVTIYVGGIRFFQPIHVGDLVEVRAVLVHTGSTSMHIIVDVQAGSPRDNNLTKTTHCITVFVALDENGRPTAVPKWQPESSEDKALQDYALRLMELRKDIEAEMQPYMK
jgi:acyl-CoA hydrolase